MMTKSIFLVLLFFILQTYAMLMSDEPQTTNFVENPMGNMMEESEIEYPYVPQIAELIY